MSDIKDEWISLFYIKEDTDMATNAIGTESTGYMNQAETISQAKQVSGKTI